MRILLLGSGGLLGGYLRREMSGHELTCVSRNSPMADLRLDASDFRSLESAIKNAKPELVINAVKSSMSTDKAEEMGNRRETWKSNVLVPDNVSRLQKEHGYSIIHISTDWVYEGKEGEIYDEESLPYPQNFYAYTKTVAEERIARCSDYLILRTASLFGLDARGGNFFMRARESLSAGGQMEVPDDQFMQPTYAGELAAIIKAAVAKGGRGTYNAVGPDYCSRYDLAMIMCESFGWERKLVKKIPSSKRTIRVPTHLKLDTRKMGKDIMRPRPLREQIAALKEECG